MKPNTQVSGLNRINQRLGALRERMQKNSGVYIGVPAGSGNYEDGTPLAVIAAVHEFGANIQHPGGTKYVLGESGKAKFVSDSYSGDVAGTTGPHTIPIPERSFLRVPIRSRMDEYYALMRNQLPKVVDGTFTLRQVMDQAGAKFAGISQEAISSGIEPANAPSTVAQKGSSTPLINNGRLLQSITWVIQEGEGG